MTNAGSNRANSCSSQSAQAAISSGAGTRAPPSRLFAGKAAANRGKVDPVAHLVLGPTQRRLKPSEQRLASRPREGATEPGFLVARRLPHEDHARGDRAAADRRTVHAWTPHGPAQGVKMGLDRRQRCHAVQPGGYRDRRRAENSATAAEAPATALTTAAALAAGEGTAYLVRPDQHVAARWRQPAAADVRGAVLSALALAGAPPAA